MGRKKKEETNGKKPIQKKSNVLGFKQEQDMMIFTYLFTSRPDLRIKCQESLRSGKSVKEIEKDFLNIVIEGTSNEISGYKDIVSYYKTKANWKAIIEKFKEFVASGM